MIKETESKYSGKSGNLIKNKCSILLMLMICGLFSKGCQANPQAESMGNNLTENKTINTTAKNQVAPGC